MSEERSVKTCFADIPRIKPGVKRQESCVVDAVVDLYRDYTREPSSAKLEALLHHFYPIAQQVGYSFQYKYAMRDHADDLIQVGLINMYRKLEAKEPLPDTMSRDDVYSCLVGLFSQAARYGMLDYRRELRAECGAPLRTVRKEPGDSDVRGKEGLSLGFSLVSYDDLGQGGQGSFIDHVQDHKVLDPSEYVLAAQIFNEFQMLLERGDLSLTERERVLVRPIFQGASNDECIEALQQAGFTAVSTSRISQYRGTILQKVKGAFDEVCGDSGGQASSGAQMGLEVYLEHVAQSVSQSHRMV